MDELREAMEAAYEKAETEATANAEPEVPETPEPETPEVSSDDSHETNESPAPISDDNGNANEPEKPAAEKPEQEPAEKPAADKHSKAPASWAPKAKEAWKGVPDEARAQITKREAEINQTLQQTAQARQGMQNLNAILEPYRGGLMAAGVTNPFNAIQTLFQTEAQLRSGTAAEKANTVATLIKQYSVDIGTLDDILSGEKPQNNPGSQIEQLIDQRLAPVNQFLQQQQFEAQQSEYAAQNNANQSVAEFAKNAEFLEYVRNDMADLLDMAAARGEQMTMDAAYQKACAIHPEVSAVIVQRDKEKQIMGTQQNMQQKRNAASASLTGVKGGDGGGNTANSLRDVISDAWNSQTG